MSISVYILALFLLNVHDVDAIYKPLLTAIISYLDVK